MRHLVLCVLLAAPAFADDACDITLRPAATLLLPYFEVDFKSPPSTAQTTLFTIQNVSPYPQIAHVVMWTDWSFPAIDFNIFLTGYDVQGINLYDILAGATIAPTSYIGGTSSNTTVPTNPSPGSQPFKNDQNPHITSLSGCSNLPGRIPPAYVTDLQLIFTTGKGTGAGIPCVAQVGGQHEHAIGYVTVDLVSSCHTSLPTEPIYFTLLLFDNVLTGDYQQIVPRAGKSYAQGGPLVHIRAVPEGGAAGAVVATNLPYTFYDRYTSKSPTRTIDRRQPLPATFAPRFILGGTGGFNTSFKIWREAVTAGTCNGTSASSLSSAIRIEEIVRFDEHENATLRGCCCILCGPDPFYTPATLSVAASSNVLLPPMSLSGDVGGWLYMNLDNGSSTARPSQNWVVTSMFAEPSYAVEMPATALGNGCSPKVRYGAPIAPVP